MFEYVVCKATMLVEVRRHGQKPEERTRDDSDVELSTRGTGANTCGERRVDCECSECNWNGSIMGSGEAPEAWFLSDDMNRDLLIHAWESLSVDFISLGCRPFRFWRCFRRR